LVRHHPGGVDLVRRVIEEARADMVVFGDEPVAHIDIVLEKRPKYIVQLEELPVKGVDVEVADGRGRHHLGRPGAGVPLACPTCGYSISRRLP
jgi:hypothetical protein